MHISYNEEFTKNKKVYMNKKILIQFGLNAKRMEKLIPACKKVGLEWDFFSYYLEDRMLDDFPTDFLENEYLAFVPIPVLLYSLKRSAEHYKNKEDFEKFNEHLIKMTYGNQIHRCEQEFIAKGIQDKSIPYLPMLNENSTILDMNTLIGKTFDEPAFLKPNSAYKEFIGSATLPKETFEDFLIRTKYCGKPVEVMYAPHYDIHSEYRFFVYEDYVTTGSSYIVDKKFNINYEIPEAVWVKAREFAKLYQPTKCFTLDLCLLANGDIKIVEHNHFSASGNYNADMSKVFEAFIADGNYLNFN